MSDDLSWVVCLIVVAVNWLVGCAVMDLLFKERGDEARHEGVEGDDRQNQ
jgi:hypothetical protein